MFVLVCLLDVSVKGWLEDHYFAFGKGHGKKQYSAKGWSGPQQRSVPFNIIQILLGRNKEEKIRVKMLNHAIQIICFFFLFLLNLGSKIVQAKKKKKVFTAQNSSSPNVPTVPSFSVLTGSLTTCGQCSISLLNHMIATHFYTTLIHHNFSQCFHTSVQT